MNVDEIGALWDKIDKKGLVQYKLKVELSPEVMAKVKSLTGEQDAQVSKSDVMNTVKANITDKMLIDSRDKK